MKKKDKEKILDYIDRLSSSLVWCFNEEWTSKYMNHFIDMKKESMLYNNEFVKMHLSILEENDINDTTEGFDEEHKKIETELCNFFTTNFIFYLFFTLFTFVFFFFLFFLLFSKFFKMFW